MPEHGLTARHGFLTDIRPITQPRSCCGESTGFNSGPREGAPSGAGLTGRRGTAVVEIRFQWNSWPSQGRPPRSRSKGDGQVPQYTEPGSSAAWSPEPQDHRLQPRTALTCPFHTRLHRFWRGVRGGCLTTRACLCLSIRF